MKSRRAAGPCLALESLKGTVIIDEVQHLPHLFTHSVCLWTNKAEGSLPDSGQRVSGIDTARSETLAGRIDYVELTPFSLTETGPLNKPCCGEEEDSLFLSSPERNSQRGLEKSLYQELP